MLARLCWAFHVRTQIHWKRCRPLPRYVQAPIELNVRDFVTSILCFDLYVVEVDRPVVVAVDRDIRANGHLWKHLVKRLWVYSGGDHHAKIRPYFYRETACTHNVAVIEEALGSRARVGWMGGNARGQKKKTSKPTTSKNTDQQQMQQFRRLENLQRQHPTPERSVFPPPRSPSSSFHWRDASCSTGRIACISSSAARPGAVDAKSVSEDGV